MAIDKRLHPRFPTRLKLRYRSGDERWRPAFTKEVSTTGMYILSGHIPASAHIDIEVTSGNGTIPFRGRVLRGDKVPPRLRRVMPGGIAVVIMDPPDAWCRLCLDLEEKSRERGAIGSTRFVQATTEVNDPSDTN